MATKRTQHKMGNTIIRRTMDNYGNVKQTQSYVTKSPNSKITVTHSTAGTTYTNTSASGWTTRKKIHSTTTPKTRTPKVRTSKPPKAPKAPRSTSTRSRSTSRRSSNEQIDPRAAGILMVLGGIAYGVISVVNYVQSYF